MPTNNRFRDNDRPDHSPNSTNQSEGSSFSTQINKPKKRDLRIKHSAVNNEGYKRAHAEDIKREEREDIQRKRDQEKRQKDSAAATKLAASNAKKQKNADFEKDARSSGAKIYKDEFGDWQNVTDSDGRKKYTKTESDPYKNEAGRMVRKNRDEYGKESEVDADKDVKWTMGKNGTLVKKNKHNPEESKPASEFTDDEEYGALANQSLYKQDIAKRAQDVAAEKLALRDPSLGGLTDAKRDDHNEEITGLKEAAKQGYGDPGRVKDLKKQLEADDAIRARKKALHEKESETMEMVHGGVDVWSAKREEKRREAIKSMSQEDFNKDFDARNASIKTSAEELKADMASGAETIATSRAELEADQAELQQMNQRGVRADEVEYFNQKRDEVASKVEAFNKQLEDSNKTNLAKQKALIKQSDALNVDAGIRNEGAFEERERQIQDLHKTAESIAPEVTDDFDSMKFGEVMPPEQQALGDAYRDLAEEMKWVDEFTIKDEGVIEEKIEALKDAEIKMNEGDMARSEQRAKVYEITTNLNHSKFLEQFLDNREQGIGETSRDALAGGLDIAELAIGGNALRGLDQKSIDQVKALLPGNVDDKTAKIAIIDAIRENLFDPTNPNDDAHVLSDGRVVVNPANIFHDSKAKASIKDQDTSDFRKDQALKALVVQQTELTKKLHPQLMEYSKDYQEFIAANPEMSNKDALLQFHAENVGAGGFWESIGIQLMQGYASTASSLYGAVFVASAFIDKKTFGGDGWDGAKHNMQAKERDAAGRTATASAEGHVSNLATDVAQAAPSLVPTFASGGLGKGAGALTKLMTKGAKGIDKATKYAAVASKWVGGTSMYGSAFAQSYGGAGSARLAALTEIHGEAKAIEMISGGAEQLTFAAQGLTTVLLMKLNPGGTESIVNGSSKMLSFNARQIMKLAKGKGGLQKMFTDKALRAEIGTMLKETVWAGAKDEFREEGLDQFFQGVIEKIAHGGDKTMGELIAESFHAGVIGGLLGGGTQGVVGNFEKGDPIGKRLEQLEASHMGEYGSRSSLIDEVSMAELEVIADQPDMPELTPAEKAAAVDMTPEFGRSSESSEIYKQIEQAKTEAMEAFEAGDVATAKAAVNEAEGLYKEVQAGHKASVKRAVQSTREISQFEATAKQEIQDAQAAHQQAIIDGDKGAAEVAVGRVEKAKQNMAKVHQTRGMAKISAGKPLSSLTGREANSLGIKKNFSTGAETNFSPMTDSELEAQGLEAPLIDAVDGQIFVTDSGTDVMNDVSPEARAGVKHSETQRREQMVAEQAAQVEAEEAATKADKAPTPSDKAPTPSNEAGPQTFTATGKNGTKVSVEANSAAEAQPLLAAKLSKANPGEMLNLDTVKGSKVKPTNKPATKKAPQKEAPAFRRKAMEQVAKLPKGKRAKALKVYKKIEAAIEKVAASFDGVQIVDNLTGGGFAVRDGKLLVDPVRLNRQLEKAGAKSVEKWLEAALIEEQIHAAATKVVTEAEAIEIWNSVPDRIKKLVEAAYDPSSANKGETAKTLEPYLGFHEMVRMVIQKDSDILGYLTEDAVTDLIKSKGRTVAQAFYDILNRVVKHLADLAKTDPQLNDAVARIKEAMGAIEPTAKTPTTAPKPSQDSTERIDQLLISIHSKKAAISELESDIEKGFSNAHSESILANLRVKLKAHESELSELQNQKPTAKPAEQTEAPKKQEAFLPNGQAVAFTWKVVDLAAGDVTMSNRDTGAINPDYPQELQPRDRGSAASSAQVQDIASNTKYARLSDNPSVGDGAPMIGADGVVESGNGRMMGMRRAYDEGYENVNQYRKDLEADAANKGLDPDQVAGMKMPVLVRVREESDIDRREFVELANVSPVSSMRESERAKTDAERLTRNPETLRNLDVNADGDIFTPANKDFFQAFIAGIPANERGEMIDKNGNLNATGLRRVTNALVVAAYGSNADSTTLAKLTESIDTEGRNLLRVLVAMAPEFAEQSARMDGGTLHNNLGINSDLAQAVVQTIQLREKGEKVTDYLNQDTLGFDGDETFINELISFLETNKRAPRKAIDVLQKYSRLVEHAGNPQEGDMFGSAPERDNLWRVARKTGEKTLQSAPFQDDMFDRMATNRGMEGLELFSQAEVKKMKAEQDDGTVDVEAFDTEGNKKTVNIHKLPFSPETFFFQGRGAQQVPLDKIVKQRARSKGIVNANGFMNTLAETGKGTRRKGVTLIANGDGTYTLFDGNSTYANAAASGWESITARVLTREEAEAEELIGKQAKAGKKAIAAYEKSTGEEWPHKTDGVDKDYRSNWKITEAGRNVKLKDTDVILTVDSVDLGAGTLVIDGEKMDIKAAQKKYYVQLNRFELMLEESAINRLALAESLSPGYAETVNDLAGKFTVRADPLTAPVKGIPRLLEKNGAKLKKIEIRRKDEDFFGQIEPKDIERVINGNADLVRASIIMTNIGSKLEGLRLIKERYPDAEINVDDRFMVPVPGGYSDIQIKVEISPGFFAELQLHIPEMFASKEGWFDSVSEDFKPEKLGFTKEEGGLGHKLFEEWRSLKKELGEGEKSTPEMKVLEGRMAKLYGKAKDLYLARAEREGLQVNFLSSPSKSNKYSLKSTSLTQGAVGSGMVAGTLSNPPLTGINSTPPAIATGSPSTSQNSVLGGNLSNVGNKKAIDSKVGDNTGESNTNLDELPGFGSVSTTNNSNEKSNSATSDSTGNPVGAKLPGTSENNPVSNPVESEQAQEVDGDSSSREGSNSDRAGQRSSTGGGTATSGAGTSSEQLPSSTERGSDENTTGKPGDSRGVPTTPGASLERPTDPELRDTVIQPGDSPAPKTRGAKIEANFKAIGILRAIDQEKRLATVEERAALLQYTGWGSMKEGFNDIMAKRAADIPAFFRTNAPRYHNTSDPGFQLNNKALAWEKAHGELHKQLKEELSDEEYEQARSSTLNAHYTTPEIIDGMWNIVEKLGFKGGSVLEPGAGIGHFIGTQPKHLRDKSQWDAVELDTLTSKILSALYPETRVNSNKGGKARNVDGQGFESAKIPNNSVDLAISNIPFAARGPWQGEKQHGRKLNLHNYFFAQAMDKVKPGGLVAFITSASTMENNPDQRAFLASKGDLVGAVRLPNDAFKENAGTEVTTDILIFRKHDGNKFEGAQDFVGRKEIGSEVVTVKPAPGQEFIDMVIDQDGDMRFTDEKLEKARAQWSKGMSRPVLNKDGTAALDKSGNPKFKTLKGRTKSGQVAELFKKAISEFTERSGYNSYSGVEMTKPMVVNEYFHANPQNVLGVNSLQGSMYSAHEYTVNPDGRPLAQAMKDALGSFPSNVMGSKGPVKAYTGRAAEAGDANYSFVERDGQIFQVNGDSMEAVDWADKPKNVLMFRSWSKLRDSVKTLVQQEQNQNSTDEQLDALRKDANEIYDKHFKLFGPLNKKTRNPHRIFEGDPDYPLISAIEDSETVLGDDGKPTQKFSKADILQKRVIRPLLVPETAENIQDAVNMSLTWHGSISPQFIAEKLGQDKQKVTKDLLAKGLGFVNPQSGLIESPDSYLSGHILNKINAAKEARDNGADMDKNIKALQDVLPMTKSIDEITINIGSRWVDPKVLEMFAQEVLEIPTPRVSYLDKINAWNVTGGNGSNSQFSSRGLSPIKALSHALSMTYPTIRDSEGDFDPQGTAKAVAIIDSLKRKFSSWAKTSEAFIEGVSVQEIIEDGFNAMSNSHVPPTYRGEHITLPGAAEGVIYLKPFRKAAIARMLEQGSGLIAHGVGFGKTYTMIALAMELKRLGKAQKPMIVVQNSTIGQFAQSARKAYPNAKILIADEKNFSAKNRKKFTSQIRTGDWDMVIMKQSAFDLIQNSESEIKDYMDSQIEELMTAIAASKGEKGVKSSDLTKALDGLRETREKMLDKLKQRQDNTMPFDEIGVDALMIDEAHAYKNAPLVTKMNRVKGLAATTSQRAISLSIKTRGIQRRNNNKGVFFATGTPITNTMAEAYQMIKYVSPQLLIEQGISNFDSFAANYGEVVQSIEQSWRGKLELTNRFAKFVQGEQLIKLIRSSFDVAMSAEEAGLKRPEVTGGEPKLIVLEGDESTDLFNEWTGEIADAFDQLSPSEKKENKELGAIPIMVMQAGVAAALDPRLINENVPDSPNNKLNTAVRDIKRVYDKYDDKKAAQVVFSDLDKGFSMEKLVDFHKDPFAEAYGEQVGKSSFVFSTEMKKKLIAEGIPAKEIRVVKSSMTADARNNLWSQVNEGKVRVIIGSTELLGVGVNMQERLVAAHHMMPPRDFKPAMLEQRNGRLVRQGNLFYDWKESVDVNYYGLRGSLDATIFSTMAVKQNFINQVLMGEMAGNKFDDPADSISMNLADMAALSTGDPRQIRLIELKRELDTLTFEKEGFDDAQAGNSRKLRFNKQRLTKLREELPKQKARAKDLVGQIEADRKAGRKEIIELGNKVIDRNPPKDKPKGWKAPTLVGPADLWLHDARNDAGNDFKSGKRTLKISGLEFRVSVGIAKGENGVSGELRVDGVEGVAFFEGAKSMLMQARNIIKEVVETPRKWEDQIKELEASNPRLEKSLSEEWENEQNYKDAVEALDAIQEEIRESVTPDAPSSSEEGVHVIQSAPIDAEYDQKKSVKADILKNPEKHFPDGFPSGILDEIATWKVAIKSPWSSSAYNITNKPKSGGPEGFKRLADHWNYEADYLGDGIHSRTDLKVPNGAWAMAQYNNKQKLYLVKKVWGSDGGNIPKSKLQKTNHKKAPALQSAAVNDAKYMKAVKSGDVKAQQKMVDAKAKEAGYSIEQYYHGTAMQKHSDEISDKDMTLLRKYSADDDAAEKRYNELKESFIARGLRTSKMDLIGNYDFETYEEFKNAEYISGKDLEDFEKAQDAGVAARQLRGKLSEELQNKNWRSVRGREGEWVVPNGGDRGAFYVTKDRGIASSFASRAEDSTKKSNQDYKMLHLYVADKQLFDPRNEDHRLQLAKSISKNEMNESAKFYDNIRERDVPVLFDSPADWNYILESPSVSWRLFEMAKVQEKLKSLGFIGYTAQETLADEWGDQIPFESLGLFNPQDTKSSEPVTYDKDGNVIPLSERFNDKSDSILQSAPAVIDRDDLADMESDVKFPTSSFDLKKAWDAGDHIYMVNEMDEEPVLVNSQAMLLSNTFENFVYFPRGSFNVEDLQSAPVSDDPVDQLMAELEADLPADMEHFVEQAAKETPGDFTFGNPDLAYGASDPIARGVDHARFQERERMTNSMLNDTAKKLIKDDEEGVMRQLFDAAASGRSLDHPAMVRAAALLRVKLSKEAMRTGDPKLMKKAQILTWAYRETGTAWAREGFARRDLYQNPADRARDFLMESLTGHDPVILARFKKTPQASQMLRRIDNLQKQLRDQKAADNTKAADRTEDILRVQNEKYLEMQNAEFEAYRNKVTATLKKLGITMDDIFGERVILKLKAQKLKGNVKSQLDDKLKQVVTLLEARTPVKQIIKETGLSRRQVNDALNDYRMKMIKELETFGDAALRGDGSLITMQEAKDLLESAPIQAAALTEEERQKNIMMIMKAMGIPETLTDYETQPKPKKKKKTSKPQVTLTPEQLAEIEERFEKFKNKDTKFFEAQLTGDIGLDYEQARIIAAEWNKQLTDPKNVAEFSERFDSVNRPKVDLSDPAHVAGLYRVLDLERGGRTVDVLKEIFINNILSAPITQITNLTGMAYGGYEMTLGRAIEATFNKVLQKDGQAEFGEFNIIRKGLKAKMAQSLDLALRAFDTETSPFEQEFLDAQIEIGFNPMHDTRGFRPVIKGKKGRIMRIPGRALLFTDTFFKSLIALVEVGAMAYRLGRANGLEKGSQELEDFIGAQSATPGSASYQAAATLAEKYTFTNKLRGKEDGGGGVENAVKQFSKIMRHGGQSPVTQSFEMIATMFFPFITTPFRLLQLGMSKTMYGGAYNAVRVLSSIRIVDGKIAVKNFSDAQKLGMMADGLFAAMATGVLWSMAEGDDDDDDKWFLISGSRNKEAGLRGIQYRTVPPNHFRIGGVLVNYGRLDPFSTVIGTTVDTIRAIKQMKDGREQEKALAQFQSWMVGQVEGKTAMSGMQDLGKLVGGQKSLSEWGVGQVSSVFVPNLIKNPLRNADQYLRDTRTDPFSAESLAYTMLPNPWFAPPVRQDVYGEDVERHGGGAGGWFSQTLNPFRHKYAKEAEAWDKFLVRYNKHNPNETWAPLVPKGVYKKVVGGDDIKMTAEQNEKFQKFRGAVLRGKLAAISGMINKERPTVDDQEKLRKAWTDSTKFAKERMFPKLSGK